MSTTATFRKTKITKNRAIYRQDGSSSSVRVYEGLFATGLPESFDIVLPEGNTFAEPSSAIGGGASIPADVRESMEKVKAFRAARKTERDAARAEDRARRGARGEGPAGEDRQGEE